MGGRRKSEASDRLLERGVLTVVLGLAFLLAPTFLSNSPLRGIAQGLRLPGWVAIGLGGALIALHRVLKPRRAARSTLPNSPDMFPPDGAPAPGVRRADTPQQGGLRAAQSSTTPTRQEKWSKQVFADIEWRRFEAVCEHLFAQAGFEARAQSHGADGGVDIWLYSKNAQGPAAIVQCKHWTKPVGVKEVREFLGVMTSKRLQRGTFATTSTFTAAAVEFAKANGINAMDGDRLLALIAQRTPEQQVNLLSVAYEGEYWRPTCASCGVKLVDRKSGRNDTRFWGCPNYPGCRTTMQMRA